MGRIIVIGAGASGLMAAITAGRLGAPVTILERMEKPGKKLLMTGNGRCNLTNLIMREPSAFRGEKPEFACKILEQFGAEDVLDFFHGLGVLTKERSGYIYPYTDQAATVLDALLLEAGRLGIRIKCKEEAKSIRPLQGGGFQIETNTWTYEAEQIILSAGTMAASSSGFDDSGFRLADRLGHRIVTPLPALVPLTVSGGFPEAASGVRCPAKVTLYLDEKPILSDQGELQWTSYGISGIVVFQLSHFAARGLSEGKKAVVELDLLPDESVEELKQMAAALMPELLLNGLFAKKLQHALVKACFGKKRPKWDEASLIRLLEFAKRLRLSVRGTKGFAHAQVCSGGVSVEEVHPQTLESSLAPGLYVTGELLDIDGICGGYNLQWAWSTGYVAGKHAAQKQKNLQGGAL